MYYCDTPHRGASRGGCNENAFSNATLVFMQSLTGNKTVVKLLAAGGTNCQPSCVAKLSTKYLGYYHNQASPECVARWVS